MARSTASLEKALSEMDFVLVADDTLTETARFAHAYIPLAAWHEMEGTAVNCLGIIQKTGKVAIPPRDRRPFYEAVSLWLRAADRESPDPAFGAWFAKVKEALPMIRDLAVRDLLPHGASLDELLQKEMDAAKAASKKRGRKQGGGP